MKSDRLKVVSVEKNERPSLNSSRPKTNREEAQARLERMWHLDPEQFNPLRNCMDKERISRTFSLVESMGSLKAKEIADLGCGQGVLSRLLRDAGASVTAVDVSKNALEFLKPNGANIHIVHDCLPSTKLNDSSYDLVLCTDVIAFLNPKEHRLLMSELARLVNKEGCVVCSTSIDIHSEDALERFCALAQTEFNILRLVLSYHSLYIKLRDFFEAPRRFSKARKDALYRFQELKNRHHLSRWWFKVNSNAVMGALWQCIYLASAPIASFIRQNTSLLLFLENLCRFFQGENGISHALFVAQRRPITEIIIEESPVIEEKRKKPVWE